MVTISNSSNTRRVPYSVYMDVYKSMGYYIVSGDDSAADTEIEEDDLETAKDEDGEQSHKPFSEMNFKELQEFAESKGINTRGMTTKRDIKNALESI